MGSALYYQHLRTVYDLDPLAPPSPFWEELSDEERAKWDQRARTFAAPHSKENP